MQDRAGLIHAKLPHEFHADRPGLVCAPNDRVRLRIQPIAGITLSLISRRRAQSYFGAGAGMNSIPCRWPIEGTFTKSSGTVRTSRFISSKNADE